MHQSETLQAFRVFCELSGTKLPDQAFFESQLTKKEVKTGSFLFHHGEKNPFIFILIKGILKMLYETADGKLWIKGFIEPYRCFASLTALEDKGLTSYSVQAQTDSVIYQLPYTALIELSQKHLDWQYAISNAFKIYGQKKELREMELLTLSPTERYLNFIKTHKSMMNAINQHEIASYIGITPVALSRIKKRLKNQESFE